MGAEGEDGLGLSKETSNASESHSSVPPPAEEVFPSQGTLESAIGTLEDNANSQGPDAAAFVAPLPVDHSWGKLLSLNPELESCSLTKSSFLLGRHQECDVRFTNPLVSNRHCVIFKEVSTVSRPGGNGLTAVIEDLSSNGTYVNGQRLGRGNRRILAHNDEIQLAINIAVEGTEKFNDKFYLFKYTHLEDQSGDEPNVHSKYIIGKTLGTGNFAEVKIALDRSTGQNYAIKIVDKRRFVSKPKFTETLRKEIGLLMTMRHDGIISVVDVFDEAETLYIVLEFVRGGDLCDYIINNGNFRESTAKILFRQMLEAVKYLHDRNITHRDLKPENILIEPGATGSPDDMILKVSDFGLATLVGEHSFMKTVCGTPQYVAPEVLTQAAKIGYGKAVDLWSLGVILYICLCGFPPFVDDDPRMPLMEQIKRGRYNFPSPYWDPISEKAKGLIRQLIEVDPAKRLTADQALAHEWFADLTAADVSAETTPRKHVEFKRGLTRIVKPGMVDLSGAPEAGTAGTESLPAATVAAVAADAHTPGGDGSEGSSTPVKQSGVSSPSTVPTRKRSRGGFLRELQALGVKISPEGSASPADAGVNAGAAMNAQNDTPTRSRPVRGVAAAAAAAAAAGTSSAASSEGKRRADNELMPSPSSKRARVQQQQLLPVLQQLPIAGEAAAGNLAASPQLASPSTPKRARSNQQRQQQDGVDVVENPSKRLRAIESPMPYTAGHGRSFMNSTTPSKSPRR